MRNATDDDAELLLRLYEIRREPELRRARQWFLHEFKPGAWSEIKARYMSFHDEDRWFRMTTSYWEMVGSMVNRGVPHPEMFFDHTGEDIVTWERCKSWIADARADIRPSYLIQFERMVAAHLEYRRKVNAAVLAEAKVMGVAPGDGAAPRATAKAAAPAKAAAAAKVSRANAKSGGGTRAPVATKARPAAKAGASSNGGAGARGRRR